MDSFHKKDKAHFKTILVLVTPVLTIMNFQQQKAIYSVYTY